MTLEKLAICPVAWKKCLLCALVAYALVVGIHMLQPMPLPDALTMVDGEPLLATHDAYTWLAKATDSETFGPHPFATMTKWLATCLGLSLETFAFWSPPFLAALVACAMVGWACLLGCPELGIAAGVVTALAPSFLYRTLLGFYDTDLVVLLFPILLALPLAVVLHGRILPPGEALRRWLASGSRLSRAACGTRAGTTLAGWLGVPGDEPLKAAPSFGAEVCLFLAGLLGWFMQDWHVFFIYIAKIYPVVALALVSFLGPKGHRTMLFTGVALYALPSGGWLGASLGLVLLLARYRMETWGARLFTHWAFVPVVVLATVFAGVDGGTLGSMIHRVQLYSKPAGAGDIFRNAGILVDLPGIVQSIIEAQNLSVSEVFSYLYPVTAIAVLGCVGFVVSMWMVPALALLAPLLVLALLSYTLGGRMAMFGGPAVGLGLILPLHFFLQAQFPAGYARRGVRVGVAVALTALLSVPILGQLPYLPVTPFLSAAHVKALKAVKPATPDGAGFWTWWDWGYATQYFAGRQTFADGARHNSDRLYPLAAVLSTKNPRFASQFIKYLAVHDWLLTKAWGGKEQQEVLDILNDLGTRDMGIVPPHPQYLVVTADSLKLGRWISRYGTWDMLTRDMPGYHLTKLGQISLNAQLGSFTETRGSIRTPAMVESIDILTEDELDHTEFFRFNGAHLVIDSITNSRFVMDSDMYASMMVRLLLRDPEDPEITPYFRLIFDNVHTRVYEVL